MNPVARIAWPFAFWLGLALFSSAQTVDDVNSFLEKYRQGHTRGYDNDGLKKATPDWDFSKSLPVVLILEEEMSKVDARRGGLAVISYNLLVDKKQAAELLIQRLKTTPDGRRRAHIYRILLDFPSEPMLQALIDGLDDQQVASRVEFEQFTDL
jgi:hypothetical protein